jgi:hypothetical protein
VPPQQGTSEMRMKLAGDLGKAPGGGALMYFYVRDTKARDRIDVDAAPTLSQLSTRNTTL